VPEARFDRAAAASRSPSPGAKKSKTLIVARSAAVMPTSAIAAALT